MILNYLYYFCDSSKKLDINKSNCFTLKILCKNGTAGIRKKYESTDLGGLRKTAKKG